MRRSAHIFLWSQRGPSRSRFPLPNEIWKWTLKPAEFLLLSYIYYNACGSRATLTPKLLAEAVHLCEDTTRKHLTALTERNLVTPELTPTLPCDGGGNFFSLPVEIFLLKLPASALTVYAYLLYRENRRTGKCHPSYRVIAERTHMAVNTVRKQISLLGEMQFISVERTEYIDRHGMKMNGNNRYTILPVRPVVNEHYQRQLRRLEADVERRRIQKRLAKQMKNTAFSYTPPKAPFEA